MAPKKRRAVKRQVWNKGLVIGKRDGLTPAQVKRIRGLLDDRGTAGIKELALFTTAIDTMLRSVIKVRQTRGAPPVRRALSRVAVRALEKWIAASGKKRTDYLFSGRGGDRPMSTRQLSYLVKLWITEAGLDPKRYSTESLRRAKALHILRGTGDLQTVRALLGHVQIESTARYLGLKTKADPIEVSRAFAI